MEVGILQGRGTISLKKCQDIGLSFFWTFAAVKKVGDVNDFLFKPIYDFEISRN